METNQQFDVDAVNQFIVKESLSKTDFFTEFDTTILAFNASRNAF